MRSPYNQENINQVDIINAPKISFLDSSFNYSLENFSLTRNKTNLTDPALSALSTLSSQISNTSQEEILLEKSKSELLDSTNYTILSMSDIHFEKQMLKVRKNIAKKPKRIFSF